MVPQLVRVDEGPAGVLIEPGDVSGLRHLDVLSSQHHPLGAEQWDDVLPVIGVQQSERSSNSLCKRKQNNILCTQIKPTHPFELPCTRTCNRFTKIKNSSSDSLKIRSPDWLFNYKTTSGFWPRVCARALRAPVFLGFLTWPNGALRAPLPRLSQLRFFLFITK